MASANHSGGLVVQPAANIAVATFALLDCVSGVVGLVTLTVVCIDRWPGDDSRLVGLFTVAPIAVVLAVGTLLDPPGWSQAVAAVGILLAVQAWAIVFGRDDAISLPHDWWERFEAEFREFSRSQTPERDRTDDPS
jgi:hypothetical protein